MKINKLRNHRAFTLVELLVVIAIIALLGALITPAVYTATVRAKNARIGLEIAAIEKALEAYKLEMGEYPPDFAELAAFPESQRAQRASQIIDAHLGRVFRRRNAKTDSNFNVARDLPRLDNGQRNDEFLAGLNPKNALLLWLGGFTSDPELPLFGSGPRSPFFEFDKGRISPTKEVIEAFAVTQLEGNSFGSDEVESFASLTLAEGYNPKGKATPYVYYRAQPSLVPTSDAISYTAALIWALDNPWAEGGVALPAVSSAITVPDPTNSGNGLCTYVAPEKFQLLSAGLDDSFGSFAYPTTNPPTSPLNGDGSMNYSVVGRNNGVISNGRFEVEPALPSFPRGKVFGEGQSDNLTNFSAGKTLEDSKEE